MAIAVCVWGKRKKERYQANDIDSEYRSFKLNDAVEKKKW